MAGRTRMKFCGLTRVVDVDAAVAIGADAVGFNCYEKSSRFVPPSALAKLAARVPAFVTPVLLFVNAEEDAIRGALEVVPHAVLQFHGDESADRCRVFRRPYVRALRVNGQTEWAALECEYADAAALLADAPAAGYGGSGQVFDWSRLPRAASRRVPLVLAGGLDATNVRSAIEAVRPYAVDVSSGIEDAPGLKSALKMREFASAVLAAPPA
jgi:phosphoribosylanthranilate isomerase